MKDLEQIVSYLDAELDVANTPDYPQAYNGLQLQNSGRVDRVYAAVDASLPVISKISEGLPHSLLLVHHGLFWQGVQPLVGAVYEKSKKAFNAELAIYSSHIPLDIHPKWGNNVQLAERLGLENQSAFFDWKGIQLGIKGDLNCSLHELLERLERSTHGKIQSICSDFEDLGKIGIITGGAGSELAEMHQQGVKTFITGEAPHWAAVQAQELGVNLLCAGHYATETFGVKVLGEALAAELQVDFEMIEAPTGF